MKKHILYLLVAVELVSSATAQSVTAIVSYRPQFGEYEQLSPNITYQAPCDGFVVSSTVGVYDSFFETITQRLKVDLGTNQQNLNLSFSSQGIGGNNGPDANSWVTIPVPANYYYKVDQRCYWMPINNQPFTNTTWLTSDTNFVSTIIKILSTNNDFITAIASNIVAAVPNNYDIATKSDLGTAVSNAVSQTVSQVQSQPNTYNLFNAEQYAANYNNGVVTGTALVTANPSSYNLYDSNSIMDLRMNGLMMQKNGSNAVVSFQPQTTTDLTQPFTNNGTPITNEVPMPGDKGFIRIQANPAATPAAP
jgi:hypothetical protein